MTTEDWIVAADRLSQSSSLNALQAWIKAVPTQEVGALSGVLPRVYAGLACSETSAEQWAAQVEVLRPLLYKTINALGATDLSRFESHDDAYTFSRTYLTLLMLDVNMWEKILKKAFAENAHECLYTALHRLVAAQIYIHLAYYQFYLPMPAKEWLKLHKLFQLAEQRKQSEFAVHDVCLFPGQHLTISNLYIIALLLGCARTNKLSPNDIRRVFDLLKTWSSMVTISRTLLQSGDNQLVVDIAAGAAPNFYKLFNANEKSVLCYLQIEPLMGRMNTILYPDHGKNFAALAAGDANIDHNLINHLKSAWSEYLHREERITTQQSALACIGLPDTHYYLSGNKKLTDFIGVKSTLSIMYENEEDVSSIVNDRSADIWSFVADAVDGDIAFKNIPAEFNFQRHFDADFNDDGNNHCMFEVAITNTSAHGCGLQWTIGDKELPLRVGELIGLKKQDSTHLHVGIIMWMDYSSKTVLHTGIKIISTEAFPVGVDIPLAAAAQKNITEGIFLPFQPEFNSALTLIVESDVVKKGDCTSVSQKHIDERIKITDHITSGPSFCLHECGFIVKNQKM